MGQKLVSVIIPTYNRADLVISAIESVVAQTYRPIQIIVTDDGSSDDTARRIAEIEGVEYYYQEHAGQAAARNLGLSYAKGEYIASLDSDDTWDKNFLEIGVEAINEFEADFVFLNWREVCDAIYKRSDWQESKEFKRHANTLNEDWILLGARKLRSLYLKECPSPSSALLIRRSSLSSPWNEEMRIADDWYLILEMVLRNPCRAAFTLSPYWTKTIHTSNIYHGRDPLEVVRDLGIHDETLIARDFYEHLTFSERNILKKRLSKHYFNFGRLRRRRDGLSKTLESFVLGFTLAPIGIIFYLFQLSFNHLKNRVRIARTNRGIASKDLAPSKPA